MAGMSPHPAPRDAPEPSARTPRDPPGHGTTRVARLVERHPAWSALAAAVATLAVKHRGIAARSVWLDEAWTVALGAKSASAILVTAAHDENPPLYNVAMAAWLALSGTSELALRLPSLLASAACAAALLVLLRRFFGGEAALYGSLLLLVSAAQTHYATEGRAYALVALLCVVSYHLTFALLERPRWGPALALAVVNAAGVSVHYTTGLAWLAQALGVLAFARRDALRCYVASQILALALFAPLVPLLLANLPVAGKSWLLAPDAAALHAIVRELVGSRSALRAGVALALGYAVWRIAARRHGAAPRPIGAVEQRIVIAALWAVVPLSVAFVVSQWSPILHVRYELFAGLGWIVAIAGLLALLPWPAWARTATALLMVLLSAKAGPHAATRDPRWREIAAMAGAGSSAPPAIVVLPSVECIPFAYYAAPDTLHDLFAASGAYDVPAFHRALAARRIECREPGWPQAGEVLPAGPVVLVLAHLGAAETDRVLAALHGRGRGAELRGELAGKRIYDVMPRSPAAAHSATR